MKIQLRSPFVAMRGSYKNCDLVFTHLNGQTIARRKSKPANPRTPDQTKNRAHMTNAARAWCDISHQQREMWQRYAEAFLHGNGRMTGSLGMSAFMRANTARQTMGLETIADAPTQPPPPQLIYIKPVAGFPDDAIAIEVRHAYGNVAGYYVLLRATPPGPAHRTPRMSELRLVCGICPESFRPLPPDGGHIVFAPVKYPLIEGQRFALEARIVRAADGLASEPVSVVADRR